jgi:hypothetical protein
METQGLIIVFGSLLAAIILIVAGAFLGGPWGHAALALGIIGVIAWVIFALWLARALNSDI